MVHFKYLRVLFITQGFGGLAAELVRIYRVEKSAFLSTP